ncbi:MAG: hypothetical protein ACLTK7_11945 [Clostridium paraputrificum]|uniref:hypothetical protein n=1 Tax=Clostridium paraputrificum TaxID=29363 RepID=UPI000C07B7D7|nr:hypothetical protein [Clostridium paraputrificum]
MKREFYVYGWIRLDRNEFFYMGKGKGNRAFVPKTSNKHFMNIYRSVDTAVIFLEENLTEKKALELEQKYIEHLVFDIGYGINIKGFRESEVGLLTNCTWGGEGTSGRACKEITKKRISIANKGRSHLQTEYTKKIISKKLRAYKKTDEHKKNIANALKGRIINPEALEKMILWSKTAPRSEIHRNNISLALTGKERSESHSKAISKTLKSKKTWVGKKNPKAEAIVIIFPDGKELKFDTKSDANDIMPRTIIRRCLKSQEPYKVPRNFRRRYGYLEGVSVRTIKNK